MYDLERRKTSLAGCLGDFVSSFVCWISVCCYLFVCLSICIYLFLSFCLRLSVFLYFFFLDICLRLTSSTLLSGATFYVDFP